MSQKEHNDIDAQFDGSVRWYLLRHASQPIYFWAPLSCEEFEDMKGALEELGFQFPAVSSSEKDKDN